MNTFVSENFGCNVIRRATWRQQLRATRLNVRQAKVSYFDLVAGNEDVLRLQITMSDVFVMHVAQAFH